MTNVSLCRSASRSTRRSRTVPSQCSQVKPYMPDTSLDFIHGKDQELIAVDKTNYDTDGRFLISRVTNDYISRTPRVLGQNLVDLACENRGFDIQYIEVVLGHFIISVFCQRVLMVEHCSANAFECATGH